MRENISVAAPISGNCIPLFCRCFICALVERGSWFIHKKVTRQQFYGMLTGSVIFDSVDTDNRLVRIAKLMLCIHTTKFFREKFCFDTIVSANGFVLWLWESTNLQEAEEELWIVEDIDYVQQRRMFKMVSLGHPPLRFYSNGVI